MQLSLKKPSYAGIVISEAPQRRYCILYIHKSHWSKQIVHQKNEISMDIMMMFVWKLPVFENTSLKPPKSGVESNETGDSLRQNKA